MDQSGEPEARRPLKNLWLGLLAASALAAANDREGQQLGQQWLFQRQRELVKWLSPKVVSRLQGLEAAAAVAGSAAPGSHQVSAAQGQCLRLYNGSAGPGSQISVIYFFTETRSMNVNCFIVDTGKS